MPFTSPFIIEDDDDDCPDYELIEEEYDFEPENLHVLQLQVDLVDYDVVIGSVHLVKYKDLTCAYSGIDFSKLKEETIIEYLDAYFDDVLTMIETTDFDILAHLTCPLRYIKGKYNIDIDKLTSICYNIKNDFRRL